MKHRSRLLSAVLAAFLTFGTASAMPAAVLADTAETTLLPTTSRDDAPEAVKTAVSNLICSFGNADQLGVTKYLGEIQELSPNEWYPIYRQVIDFWNYAENDMVNNIDVAPDGIADPAHHCFIVLGYALKDDGTMTDELIGRLTVAKNSLDKYPDAHVLVTGGVEKNGWTEGVRMRDWLVANRIDESRIFVENKAPDTAGNATYSFDILYNDGTIQTVSLISSQYHINRGSILYYTESLLKAKELGKTPISFLGDKNAGWYREDKTSEPLSTKANSMYSICRVPKAAIPVLDTEITGLDVIFPEGNTFEQGQPLNVSVKTLDTKNENLTVTEFCTITGYDPAKVGKQTIHVSFTYKGQTWNQDAQVEVVWPENKKALAQLVDQARALDPQKFTELSWKPVAENLQLAQETLDNPQASEPQIIMAADNLQNAMNNLKKADAEPDPAPVPEKTYTVVFKGKDGQIIVTRTVKEGEDAELPDAPAVKGYTFSKWDKDHRNVHSDLVITAVYTKNGTTKVPAETSKPVKSSGAKTALGEASLLSGMLGVSVLGLLKSRKHLH